MQVCTAKFFSGVRRTSHPVVKDKIPLLRSAYTSNMSSIRTKHAQPVACQQCSAFSSSHKAPTGGYSKRKLRLGDFV